MVSILSYNRPTLNNRGIYMKLIVDKGQVVLFKDKGATFTTTAAVSRLVPKRAVVLTPKTLNAFTKSVFK